MATLTLRAPAGRLEWAGATSVTGLRRFAVASMGLLLAFPPPGAEIACVLFLSVSLLDRSFRRVPDRAIVFLAAIVLSLIPGLMVTPGPRDAVWAGFSTLLLAFGFYAAGFNAGRSASLIRDLLMGLCVAVVTHVLLAGLRLPYSHGWAFCAAGLLLAFGPTLETPLQRGVSATAGLAAAAFAFLGSGLAGTAAIATWAVLLGLVAWRSASRISYHVFLVTLAVVALALAVGWLRVGSTPMARGFVSAFERVADGALIPSVGSAVQALPFGLGAGHGRPDLAGVATELGLLGLAGFAAVVAYPLSLARRSKAPILLLTFVPAAVVFMVGNAMYREKTFLLLIGVSTGYLMRSIRPSDHASRITHQASFPATGAAWM